jgi:hypothetical protein
MFKILGFVILKIGYIIAGAFTVVYAFATGDFISIDLPLFYGVFFKVPNFIEVMKAIQVAGILMLIGTILIIFAPKPHL